MSSKIKNGCCSTIRSVSNSTRNGETKRGKTSALRVDPTGPVRVEETKSSRQAVSHLLVVDDEEYICEVIREMLSDRSYRIHTLCDPEKALDFIRTNQVDLVLTDLIMGKKSGVDVLQQTTRTG